MSSQRHSWLRVAILLLSIFSITALSSQAANRNQAADDEKFQQLLSGVDDASIHQVLSSWPRKFRDGIFSTDLHALRVVHSEDPPLATRIVQLAKRQVSNTTTTAGHTTKAHTTKAHTTKGHTTNAPKSTTKGSSPPSTPISTAAKSELQTSALPPATTQPGAVPVSTVSSDSAIVFSSSKGGALQTLSSSLALVSFSQSTETVLITTTKNGVPAVITSVEVVNAAVTTLPTRAGSSQTASPSLQSAASVTRRHMMGVLAVISGAVLFTWVL